MDSTNRRYVDATNTPIWNDTLSYYVGDAVDAKGNVSPDADLKLQFEVGTLALTLTEGLHHDLNENATF